MNGSSYIVILIIALLVIWYFSREQFHMYTPPVRPVNIALHVDPLRKYANNSRIPPGYIPYTAMGDCACREPNISQKSYQRKTFDAALDSSVPLRPGTIWIPEIYRPAKEAPLERVILFYSPCSCKHNLVAVFEQVQKHASDIAAQRGIKFEKVVRDKAQINEYETLPKVVKIRNNGQVFVYRKETDFGALYDWVMSDVKISLKDYF